jgi:hypothetical protein
MEYRTEKSYKIYNKGQNSFCRVLRGWGEEGGGGVGVRERVGAGGEMTQALYAHRNNKTIKKERKKEWQARKETSRYGHE